MAYINGVEVLSVEFLGTSDIPTYWKKPLEDGAKEINQRLCEAGSNKSAFLFYSDAHWSDGSRMSPTLLKYLYKHTGMTKTFFGGDVIGYGSKGEGTDYDTMSYLWDWRNQVKDLPNHHSVVGNHDDGQETNNLFSEDYVYGYLRAAEETPDIVRGSEGLYYYIDNIPEKTRYLFLDTAYRGATASQLDFIKQALLTTPNDWHIIAISHIWYDADYSVTPPVISDLNDNASQILELFDNYNSRNGEYEKCKGKVEFCIGGHTHRDYDGDYVGASAKRIPIILVETDSGKVRSGLNYIVGTTKESSVNGIIADYHKHKIYVVRIGRGDSREITITNYTTTNVLPLAVDVGGTPYNNGQGWKADTKYSASSNGDKEAVGTYVTGYIPIKPNDVVYLQDITMPNNDASKDAGKLFFFTALGVKAAVYSGQAVSGWEGTVRENGNLIQFTVPSTRGFSYVRIQGSGIGEDPTITVNEPIG